MGQYWEYEIDRELDWIDVQQALSTYDNMATQAKKEEDFN